MIHDDGKSDDRYHANTGWKAAFERALPDPLANPVIIATAQFEKGKAYGRGIKQKRTRMAENGNRLGAFRTNDPAKPAKWASSPS